MVRALGTDRLLRLSRGGGGGGGGVGLEGAQFSKRLNFGGSVLKMHKCEGGRNI